MTSRHTPGPWRHKGNGVIIGGVGRQYTNGVGRDQIAMVMVVGLGNEGDQAGNADLIAASPLLLSELKNLRRAYVRLMESGRERILSHGGTCDDVKTMERRDVNLRSSLAAIKAAEGEE